MKPAVFLDLDFEAARDRANEEGRILLVNVVASQNAECQEMDRTTWRDPEVEKRIAEGAIAIQIDVDADAFIAKMLVVRSTPAIVAQDRGGHVDHVERSLTASELLAWFDSIALGKTYKENRAKGEPIAGLSDYNSRWVGPEGYKGMVARQLQEFKKQQASRSDAASNAALADEER